jgi:DNA-binding response OmpR family regulator
MSDSLAHSGQSTVLVVDDEPAIRESLAFALGRDGFAVLEAGSLRAARALVEGADLLILDLMLPDGSGLDLLRWLRPRSRVPVLILSSRGDETDRVVGLELGADDYVVKPFSPREVVARVRAVLRRVEPAPVAEAARPAPTELRVGALRLDLARREGWLGSAPLDLTRLPFDLLAALMRAPGRVHTREDLLDGVWGETCVTDRTVDVHIKALRRSLAAAGGDPELIETVRGVGYRLREAP